MVPNEWKRTSVSDICSLQNGHSFKPKDWDTTGLPIIRIQNLNGSQNFNYFSGEPQDRWIVENGQILFSWAGTKGVSFGPFIWKGKKGVLNQHIFKVIAKKEVNKKWLFYILKFVTISIEEKAHGFKSTLVHVKKSDIDDHIVPLPPLLEQKKIAKILTAWDKAIITTECLIENSKQQKKALMQQLLTGQKRLLDDSGQRFSGDWVKTELKDVLHEEGTRNKNGLIERVLSVTNHSGFVLPEEQFSKRIASKDTSNYKIVKKGQFGYNPSRLNVGSFARLEDYDEGLLSPMYVIFSVIKTKLDSDFFLQWMHSHEANQRIKNSTQGSVRESVNFNALTSISVGLPSIEEQQKIATVLTSADREIEVLEQQLADLQKEKKALMQQLLTGKKRVKVD